VIEMGWKQKESITRESYQELVDELEVLIKDEHYAGAVIYKDSEGWFNAILITENDLEGRGSD